MPNPDLASAVLPAPMRAISLWIISETSLHPDLCTTLTGPQASAELPVPATFTLSKFAPDKVVVVDHSFASPFTRGKPNLARPPASIGEIVCNRRRCDDGRKQLADSLDQLARLIRSRIAEIQDIAVSQRELLSEEESR